MTTGQRLFTDAFLDMKRAVETYRESNYPPTDVIEHQSYFTLESELPGYTKKNIKIEAVDTRTLVLSGSISDNDYEAHHSKDPGYIYCEAHGKSTGPVCKSCEAGLIKAEEAQEKLSQDAQAVKVEQAQAEQKAAQVQTAQKHEEAQQSSKSTDVQASKTTGTEISMMEKAKGVVGTQAKKLETKLKKAEIGQAQKAEEAQSKKVEEAQAEHSKAQEKKNEQSQDKKEEAQVKQEQVKEEQKEIAKDKNHQRRAQYLIKERDAANSFSRTFTFPTHIETKGIKARFEDGILKAIVPKVNIEKHQSINID